MPKYSKEIERERQKWRNFERQRPGQITRPGMGQESVWDYPRPPRVERVTRRILVQFGGVVLAESIRALRVLETSSPPVYYITPADVRMEFLEPADYSTLCEWKGVARYWTVRIGSRSSENAAWSYSDPDDECGVIQQYLAFFSGKMDACYVGDQRVTAQSGDYYGGWITPDIVGPFKGEAGTETW